MFDNKKLGAYIQFLRKSRGMTQSRLAEALGLSPQAVSNWERGESMPDIALLRQIARALGTTVDRILSAAEDFDEEKYKAITEDVPQEEKTEELQEKPGDETENPKRGDVNFDLKGLGNLISSTVSNALSGLGGLSKELKPKIENIRSEVEKTVTDAGREIEDALKTSRKADRVIHVTVTGSEKDDKWNDIVAMAPFASEETLDGLVRKLDITTDLEKITALAPFLSEETIDYLVKNAIESDTGKLNIELLEGIAPFCHSLDDVLLSCNRKFTLKELVPLAPFLDEDTIDELIKKHMDN